MSPLAIRLKEIRQAKGLSQGALAALAETRQGTISLLEQGKTRRIDLDLLERIAKALGVSPAALIVVTPPKVAGKRRK
jgi:transcriptional regulator with XRE-family HTH domain